MNITTEDFSKWYKLDTSNQTFIQAIKTDQATRMSPMLDEQAKLISNLTQQEDPIAHLSNLREEIRSETSNPLMSRSFRFKAVNIALIHVMKRDNYVSSFVNWIRSKPKDFIKDRIDGDEQTVEETTKIFNKIINSEKFIQDLERLRDYYVGSFGLKGRTNDNHEWLFDPRPLGLFSYIFHERNFLESEFEWDDETDSLKCVPRDLPPKEKALLTVYKIVELYFECAYYNQPGQRDLELQHSFSRFVEESFR